MSLQYIIDGNNLMHHPVFSQHRGRNKDDRCLLPDLILKKRLTGSPKNRIIIVFDGYPNPDNLISDKSNLDVVFSRAETADARIRKMLEHSKNLKNTIVVSDDNEIKCFSRLLGAHILGVEEFITLKDKKKDKDNREELKPELSFTQAEHINKELRKIWLNSS